MDFDHMTLRHTQETVKGRHSNLPNLPMKLSSMNFEFNAVRLFFEDKESRPLSSDFNISFTLTYPNYSELLEKVRSHTLDKSSKISVLIHPTMDIKLDQDVFT